MIFRNDLGDKNTNLMITGEPGKGRGHYVKRRMVMIYALRHPLIAIKGVVNSIKA